MRRGSPAADPVLRMNLVSAALAEPECHPAQDGPERGGAETHLPSFRSRGLLMTWNP